jgi:hypothetical protein
MQYKERYFDIYGDASTLPLAKKKRGDEAQSAFA